MVDKECKFYFDESRHKAFGEFKEKLVCAPIIISKDWSKLFEMMCDVSGVALGVVFGQTRDKTIHPFFYANKSLNEAQKNYTMT